MPWQGVCVPCPMDPESTDFPEDGAYQMLRTVGCEYLAEFDWIDKVVGPVSDEDWDTYADYFEKEKTIDECKKRCPVHKDRLVCKIKEGKRRYWMDLTDDQRAMAIKLNYNQNSWDSPSPKDLPSAADLQITVENYLEKDNDFLIMQVVGLLILGVVVLSEIQHFIQAVMLLEIVNPDASIAMQAVVMVLSAFAYIFVPVYVLLLSCLVIAEVGKPLDVMKDSLALVFLVEVNNMLQISTIDSARRWKVMVSEFNAECIERAKSRFRLVASIMFIVLVLVLWILTTPSPDGRIGMQGLRHPSLLFNPARDPAAGWVFVGFFLVLFCICLALAICLSTKSMAGMLDSTKHRYLLVAFSLFTEFITRIFSVISGLYSDWLQMFALVSCGQASCL